MYLYCSPPRYFVFSSFSNVNYLSPTNYVSSIEVVFGACKEIVITNALKDQGFVS